MRTPARANINADLQLAPMQHSKDMSARKHASEQPTCGPAVTSTYCNRKCQVHREVRPYRLPSCLQYYEEG